MCGYRRLIQRNAGCAFCRLGDVGFSACGLSGNARRTGVVRRSVAVNGRVDHRTCRWSAVMDRVLGRVSLPKAGSAHYIDC